MLWKKGFTMVELLVVLIILAILVAVAAPMYFGNVDRAKASEAVAAMGTIRQALRDYRVSHNGYPTGPIIDITEALPTGVGVDLEATRYFSNGAYGVTLGSGLTFTQGASAVDFLITATGNDSDAYDSGTGKGAMKNGEVADFIVQMDNAGTIYASYKSTTSGTPAVTTRTWAEY